MFAIGVVNLILALGGVYFLVSSAWQVTDRERDTRIQLAATSWLIALVIGFITWAIKRGA